MGAIFWVGPKTHWAKSADFPIRIKIRILKEFCCYRFFIQEFLKISAD